VIRLTFVTRGLTATVQAEILAHSPVSRDFKGDTGTNVVTFEILVEIPNQTVDQEQSFAMKEIFGSSAPFLKLLERI
jgi:hypothetical protein